MIVVDTNILAYLMIKGERTEQARQLYTQNSAWNVPHLWQHEFLNVLTTLVKQGGATVDDALILWRQALALLAQREQDINLHEALAIATENGISAYDAQYLALAQALHCPLVTEDKRLAHKFPDKALTMQDYLRAKNESE